MRLEWLDVLKGIGIIFVVLSHSLPDEDSWCFRYMFSFHMPLFFFLAGYCSYYSRSTPPLAFIKKRAKRLLIPYFFFSLISLVIAPLLSVEIDGVEELVKQILFLNGRVIWNIPLWFFVGLFIIEAIFALVKSQKSSIIATSLFVCGLSGYILSHFSIKTPFALNTVTIGLVYYGLGFFCNSFGLVEKLSSHLPKGGMAIGLLWVHSGLYALNGPVDMYDSVYGTNYILFYIIALLGIFAYLFCALVLGSNPVLSFLGKNTVVILGIHFIVIRLIELATESLEPNLPYVELTLSGFIITFIALLLVIPAIVFFNKILPWAVGKSNTV